MAGGTPKKAVANFVRPLQRVLSCLGDLRIDHQGGYQLGEDYALTINRGGSARLRRSDHGHQFALRITQNYRIVEAEGDRGPYKIKTTAYLYSIDDDAGQEIFGYHWHPNSGIRLPHLHLEHGAKVGLPALQKAHFPTGRISLEEFLQLVIETFKIETRGDWRSIMQKSHDAFWKWQTWTGHDWR